MNKKKGIKTNSNEAIDIFICKIKLTMSFANYYPNRMAKYIYSWAFGQNGTNE